MLYNVHPVAALFKDVFGCELECYNHEDDCYSSRTELFAYGILNDGYYCYEEKGTWHHWKYFPWHKKYEMSISEDAEDLDNTEEHFRHWFEVPDGTKLIG